MFNIEKEKAVCFTGHCPELLNISKKEIKSRLKKAIDEAIESGFNIFISGMSIGIDVWAAEIILKKKKSNDNIKLVCVLAYKDFGCERGRIHNHRLNRILKKADFIHFTSFILTSDCIMRRDHFMADNSSRVIAAYRGLKGSTKNLITYAENMGLEILNILCQRNTER